MIDNSQLEEIGSISVDAKLPTEQRLESFIHQIKNPYRFKAGKITVKVEFCGESSCTERLINALCMS